jgi:Asp-tRNA(Asn)/Glu-tRNA(Gln) amidotransferase A subunit family amidase
MPGFMGPILLFDDVAFAVNRGYERCVQLVFDRNTFRHNLRDRRDRGGPAQLNANLGLYTTFVNLLDLAAIALLAGFRGNGLPFGISLVDPAIAEHALLDLAARLQA